MYSSKLEDVIAYYKKSHPTNRKREAIALHEKPDKTPEENALLEQHRINFEGYFALASYRGEVTSLLEIVRYYQTLHPTNMTRMITALFEKNERTDEEDCVLAEHQLLFRSQMLYQYDSLATLIDRYKQLPQIQSEEDKIAIELFEKADRTDDDDRVLQDWAVSKNRRTHEHISDQYERYGEHWF